MTNLEKLTMTELKGILENITEFRFTESKDVLDRDALFLNDLPKKTEIRIVFGNYKESKKRYISVDCTDRRNGFSGYGGTFKIIDDVIKHLNDSATKYGWKKPKGEQLSLYK